MSILLLTTAALYLLIYLYFRYAYTYWRKRGVAAMPAHFPFGNMFSVIFRYQSVNEKVCELYKTMKRDGHRYAGLYFFSRKVFVAIDPELVKGILSKDFTHFHDRGIHYDEDRDPLSAHLFSLAGDHRWRKLRAKLTPAFTPGKIRYMFGAINTCGAEMVRIMRAEIQERETASIEITDILARFTTDVIGSCAFGIECNSLRNPQAEFRQMGRRAFTQTPADAVKMILIRSFPGVARLLDVGVFARSVSNFFQRVVEETINYRVKNKIVREDFLQLLIQLTRDGKLEDDDGISTKHKTQNTEEKNTFEKLSMNEASAQAFIFFLAGFETTSTTISFALLELALNTEIQERARNELTRVLCKYDGNLAYEAIGELTYLDMIVLESLRKYPPAPVFLRKCTEDYPVPGTNVIIEKGLSVLIPAMALQRDEEFFPDPEIFDPERFNNRNKSRIKDFTYIPFGDGPRICIGMRFAMAQSKLALAVILKYFKFNLNKQTKLPIVMEKKGIVLSPVGGIWINFETIGRLS